MTIEIIEKGADKYKMTCRECGCIFSYQRGDVYKQVVHCPTCGVGCIHRGADNACLPRGANWR
jgi:hypothetical protein